MLNKKKNINLTQSSGELSNKDIVNAVNKNKKPRFTPRQWAIICTLFIIPLLIFWSFEIFYKICNAGYARVPWVPGFILSYIIFFCIYIFVYTLTNNTYFTSVTISVILVIFGVANQLKISYSDDPIFISDILFLNSTGTFFDILKDTAFDLLTKYLIVIVLFIAALFYINRLCKKNTISLMNIPQRIIVGILSAFILVGISLPIKPVNNAVMSVFFNINNRQDSYATTNMGYYFKFGVFSGLYGQMIENRLVKPDKYNIRELNSILENCKSNNISNSDLGTPNIVMIFSESFWNIDDLKEVEFDKKVASNFEKLKKEGILIDMISPSYGGISSNVEYEMLTGSSIKFFSAGYIPYMQLYRDDKYFNSPSIIQELKNNGYKTRISSTWESTLFNCKKVYEYFGVDEVYYKEDMTDAKLKGDRISDDYVADRIIKELKDKKKGEKLFTMTLTAQAHMPFKKDKYDKYDIAIKKSELTTEENDTIRSYAQGVYDADLQLKKVYEYIQTMDEPTILIFYGDHLPYLKTENGDDTTENLKYFNSGDKLSDLYNRYHTQCLILANYDIGEDNVSYLGPDLVMPYLLNNMKLEISPYYKWLYTTIDTLPASNLFITVDSKGDKYYSTNLTGKMKDTFDLRKKMNWKLFVDVE